MNTANTSIDDYMKNIDPSKFKITESQFEYVFKNFRKYLKRKNPNQKISRSDFKGFLVLVSPNLKTDSVQDILISATREYEQIRLTQFQS